MAAPAVQDLTPGVSMAEAPGDLALVEAFVNTVTHNWDDPADERLDHPAALTRWLRDHGVVENDGWEAEGSDLERAIGFREALRELLLANHDDQPPSTGALELLAGASRGAPLTVVVGSSGDHAALEPTGNGMDRAVAVLLAVIFHAMHDGTWRRLKACRNDGCQWAFYDSSRNRSGRWCDMAVCGNRAKVRAYRERHP